MRKEITMKIYTLPVGLIQTNCYLVQNGQNEAALIDPGAQPDKILRYLEAQGLTLKMVLLTHGHFDHMGGVDGILKKWDVPVYIHPLDEEMTKNPSRNASMEFGGPGITCCTSRIYGEGDEVPFGEVIFRVIHTPGHTQGSVCLLAEDAGTEGVIFTGDTVFAGSVGRTDLYGGSYPQIAASARRIAALPKNYRLLPGHGEATTLDYERETNPYLASERDI